MSKEPKMKNWPMPKDVKYSDWGETKVGSVESSPEIDDTREGIEKMQMHNQKISRRQTPKKFG
jgi:hypothetical protein